MPSDPSHFQLHALLSWHQNEAGFSLQPLGFHIYLNELLLPTVLKWCGLLNIFGADLLFRTALGSYNQPSTPGRLNHRDWRSVDCYKIINNLVKWGNRVGVGYRRSPHTVSCLHLTKCHPVVFPPLIIRRRVLELQGADVFSGVPCVRLLCFPGCQSANHGLSWDTHTLTLQTFLSSGAWCAAQCKYFTSGGVY